MTGFSEDPAPFGARLDKAAFFAWLQSQDGGRFELKDGHIVMHAGSSRAHARISTAIAAVLRAALAPEAWSVVVADFAVEIGDSVRYPDVLVEASVAHPADAMASKAPVLVAEVLSPSSVARDMHVKLAEYTSLPSLQCYLVVSQDEPIVWAWQRDAEGVAFPTQPDEIAGMTQAIDIPALGVSLPLAEIYRGVIAS